MAKSRKISLDICKNKDTYELTCYQSFDGLDEYEKTKTQLSFIKKTKKLMEKRVSMLILAVLQDFSIVVDKNINAEYERALELLKSKGYLIEITNLYTKGIIESTNNMKYAITKDNYICVGIGVRFYETIKG